MKPSFSRMTVGLLYSGGALVLTGLALWLAPPGLVLAWPGVSLAIVAGGYFGRGPAVFRKTDGRLDLSARLILGPYLLALWLWRRMQWDRRYTDNQVVPMLRLGRAVSRLEALALIDSGVMAVMDLTCEHNEAKPLLSLDYSNIQMLDLILPDFELVDEAVTFVLNRMQRGVVYLHCAFGHGRSAIVAAACLLAADRNLSVEKACKLVKTARPTVKLRLREQVFLKKYRAWLLNE